MAKAAATLSPLPANVFYKDRDKKAPMSTQELSYMRAIQSDDWRASIIAFLQGHFEPQNDKEGKCVAAKARYYRLLNGHLYRSGVCAPLLKCISQSEGKDLLNQIHSGMCSSHLGTRKLVGKVFRQGFYWLAEVSDADESCEAAPIAGYTPLTSTSPPAKFSSFLQFGR